MGQAVWGWTGGCKEKVLAGRYPEELNFEARSCIPVNDTVSTPAQSIVDDLFELVVFPISTPLMMGDVSDSFYN